MEILEDFKSKIESIDLTSEVSNDQEEYLNGAALASKIIQIQTGLIELLSKSILAGEYLENFEQFKTTIDGLIEVVSQNQLSIQDSNGEVADDTYNFLTQPLIFCLEQYKRVANFINLSLQDKDRLVLLEWNTIKQEFKLDSNYLEVRNLVDLYLVNIKSTLIDNNLIIHPNTLKNLIVLKSQLENIQILLNIVIILRDKVDFLIKKILYRLDQEDNRGYLYIYNFQDKEININDLNIGIFKDFDSKTKDHYFPRQDFNERIVEKEISNDNSIDLDYFHRRVKRYKDKNKNYIQVNNLLKEFNNDIEYSSDTFRGCAFDEYSKNVIINYMHNNEFSAYLEQEKVDPDEVEVKMDYIISLQNKTGIKNYFPFLKYAEFISLEISKKFNGGSLVEIEDLDKGSDLKIVEELIQKLQECTKRAYLNFEWCKDRNFSAFQLPFNDCFATNESGDKYVLVSSFVLPVNYKEVELDLQDLQRNLDKFAALYDVHKSLKTPLHKVTSLSKEAEKKDRRSIEILGIFSAIVLFTSSSVQIFSIKNITFDDALKFMLTFSYSLVLFIFLVWLITRENIKDLTVVHRAFFFSLIGVTISVLCYMFFW